MLYISALFFSITKNYLKKKVLVKNNNTGLYLLLDLLTINKNVFHHYLNSLIQFLTDVSSQFNLCKNLEGGGIEESHWVPGLHAKSGTQLNSN